MTERQSASAFIRGEEGSGDVGIEAVLDELLPDFLSYQSLAELLHASSISAANVLALVSSLDSVCPSLAAFLLGFYTF